MPQTKPYQPLLLRTLHGVSSLLALGAILTGFWVYNTYDGRFGQLSLPTVTDIQGIHGTFGLFFLSVLPAFALYSFHAGQKRLIQSDSLQHLTQVGKPIWWYSLHRLANTSMLWASVMAVFSGRLMQEAWLPAGELNHIWYVLHLIAWSVIVICLAIHLLLSAKVGGFPLLLSMVAFKVHPEDSPRLWLNRLRIWLRH